MCIEKVSSAADSCSVHGLQGPALARLLPWLFCAALLTGCARRYDIVLTDGTRVTNVTRPVKDKETGVLSYKDVAGNVHQKNAARVVEIVPHSDKISTPGS